MKHLLAFLLLAVPITRPSQLKFKQDGSGAVDTTFAQELGATVRITQFGAPCDGSSDDVTAAALAITALPSTGGVIDARNCSSMKIGSTWTIAKSVTVLLPSATISMGTNQIVVSPGVHNVALIGAAPYGNSVARSTAGTTINYTGTGAAVAVGDSTADTYGFTWQDITLNLESAGSAAIGIQLNRAIQYTLTRPRIHGLTSANTQKAIDLEGYTNFAGGKIEDYYLWNGNTGIYFGKNANANWIVGGIMVNNNSGGTCYNVAGDVTGQAAGNMIFGSDCEIPGGSGTAVSIDWGTYTQLFGLRAESISTYVTASANSSGNLGFMVPASATITDNGVNGVAPNSFTTLRQAQFNAFTWKLYNRTDATSTFELWAGTSTNQNIDLTWRKFDATLAWRLRKNTSENLQLLSVASVPRLEVDVSTTTFLSSEGAGIIQLNNNSNSGTGGVSFGSGGASPSTVARITSAGKFTTYNGITAVGNGVPSIHGTNIALSGLVADLAATNVYASAPVGTYRVCANARTTTSGSGTTANLNLIWTDEGGAKTDAVGTWALNSVTVTGQINKCEYIHAAAATNIQVSVTAGTYGTSVYALDATAERLN